MHAGELVDFQRLQENLAEGLSGAFDDDQPGDPHAITGRAVLAHAQAAAAAGRRADVLRALAASAPGLWLPPLHAAALGLEPNSTTAVAESRCSHAPPAAAGDGVVYTWLHLARPAP